MKKQIPPKAVGSALDMRGSVVRRGEQTPEPTRRGWIKGPALIQDRKILMKESGRSVYLPDGVDAREKDSILIRFTNLDIKNSQETIDFVSNYGLLSEEGLTTSQESLDLWEMAQDELKGYLKLHLVIEGAKRKDDSSTRKLAEFVDGKYRQCVKQLEGRKPLVVDEIDVTQIFMRAYEDGIFGTGKDFLFEEDQRNQLIRIGLELLADFMNGALANLTIGLSCEPLLVPQGKKLPFTHTMAFGLMAHDLLHYLFLQVALLSVDSTRLGRCECGNFFPLTKSNRIHCTDSCGATTRNADAVERKPAN